MTVHTILFQLRASQLSTAQACAALMRYLPACICMANSTPQSRSTEPVTSCSVPVERVRSTESVEHPPTRSPIAGIPKRPWRNMHRHSIIIVSIVVVVVVVVVVVIHKTVHGRQVRLQPTPLDTCARGVRLSFIFVTSLLTPPESLHLRA